VLAELSLLSVRLGKQWFPCSEREPRRRKRLLTQVTMILLCFLFVHFLLGGFPYIPSIMVRGILVPAALWFFEFLASSCDNSCFGNICDRSENICFLLSCLAGFLTFFRLWFVEFLLSLRSVFGVFALVPAMDSSCVEIFVIEVKIFVFSYFYVRFHYCVWNSCSYCALFWGFRSSFCIASNCVNCKP
jgi:hypothetical protein